MPVGRSNRPRLGPVTDLHGVIFAVRLYEKLGSRFVVLRSALVAVSVRGIRGAARRSPGLCVSLLIALLTVNSTSHPDPD